MVLSVRASERELRGFYRADMQWVEYLEPLRVSRVKESIRRGEAAREREQLVRSARLAGVPWRAIAKALGVTQQAVSARYGSTNKPPPGESDGG